MSLDQNLLKEIMDNLSEIECSERKKDFTIEASQVSREITKQVLNSLIISPDKLKMQIGV